MRSNHLSTVMSALVAGIHVFLARLSKQDVDGRDKPGHDSGKVVQHDRNPLQYDLCQPSSVYQLIDTYWVSRNSIMPSWAPSRPMPLCLVPPNGAAGSDTSPRFSPIMP
jgi:hypothetical protein